LKTRTPADNMTSVQALTGTLTIDIEAKELSEYDIYYKYHGAYPNLIINYNKSNIDTFIEAPLIEIYNLPKEELSDGIQPYYTVLSDGKTNLEVLTSKDGPSGIDLIPPTKLSTNTKVYTFSGSYFDDKGEEYKVADFGTIVPEASLKLYPKYEEGTRYYPVTIYDMGLDENPVTYNLEYE
jgi:hypothetical protein